MTERERLALRQFREEESERERPIKQATEHLNQLSRDIHKTIRERISTMKDDQFRVDPATTKPIPAASVPEWQREQSARFKAANPDYFACPENEAQLVGYIDRNAPGIKLVSALQLEWAYRRLREYGLMLERPQSGPVQTVTETEPQPQPEQQQPAEPDGFGGVDPATLKPRRYTSREVDMMTADQYRRAFGLWGDRRPRFSDARP